MSRVGIAICVLGAAWGCAAEVAQAPVDRLAGFRQSDRDWYQGWQRACAEASPAAFRARVRLGLAWVSDQPMAQRLSIVAPAPQITSCFEPGIHALMDGHPKESGLAYALGVWALFVKKDYPAAVQAGRSAAELDPQVAVYHELYGDAQVAAGDSRSGSEQLSVALGLASNRPDQCRLISKLRVVSPNPDEALARTSSQVLSYCQEMRQAAAMEQQLESQRQMQFTNCMATCSAGAVSCPLNVGTCAETVRGCRYSCLSTYGPRNPP